MRILVVDDDKDVRSLLVRALEREGHAIVTASSLRSAQQNLSPDIELVILDVGLPDGSGIELCRQLRAQSVTAPILMLTARTQVELRVEGLNAGADDYLAKPFAVAELRARVRALGRRGAALTSLIHSSGDVTLDISGRHARKAGKEVPITAREWAILELLARRNGRVASRADILEAVWGEASETAGNSLEVLIARLRRKLNDEMIKTLRGEGYSLQIKDTK